MDVAELTVRKRLSKKFYAALQYKWYEEGMKKENVIFFLLEDVQSVVFGFMKTNSLPEMPVQQVFYMKTGMKV